MKKVLMATLLASYSFAAFSQQGGFTSPEGGAALGGFKGPGLVSGVISVAQAKTFRNDAWVVLEGNVVRQVGKELYEFRDSSGTINVDISDKYWMGQNISPNDKVRIEGEVDKDWNSVEIDVTKVTLIK